MCVFPVASPQISSMSAPIQIQINECILPYSFPSGICRRARKEQNESLIRVLPCHHADVRDLAIFTVNPLYPKSPLPMLPVRPPLNLSSQQGIFLHSINA
jgi:hypothetical protein